MHEVIGSAVLGAIVDRGTPSSFDTYRNLSYAAVTYVGQAIIYCCDLLGRGIPAHRPYRNGVGTLSTNQKICHLVLSSLPALNIFFFPFPSNGRRRLSSLRCAVVSPPEREGRPRGPGRHVGPPRPTPPRVLVGQGDLSLRLVRGHHVDGTGREERRESQEYSFFFLVGKEMPQATRGESSRENKQEEKKNTVSTHSCSSSTAVPI